MATIKIKNSTTPGAVPSSLQEGELAINLIDNKLFVGKSPSSVTELLLGYGVLDVLNKNYFKVVSSVAEMKSLSKITYKYVLTLNYYSGKSGGGNLYTVSATDTTSPDDGGKVFVLADGGRALAVNPLALTAMQWGASGDGDFTGAGTDDTLRVQAAIDGTPQHGKLIFEPKCYNVKSVTFTSIERDFIMNGATIYGIATTTTDAIVTFTDFRGNKVYGLEIRTDGNKTTPIFMPNYNCALRLKSTNGASPTQFNNIYDLKIFYIKNALVNGTDLGQSAQPNNYPQSENFFYNYTTRGVLRPYYGNCTNAYTTFIGCLFVAQQAESTSWYLPADGWCLRNDVGEVNLVGTEFQRASQAGYAIYGRLITIVNPIWEVSCPSYITGNVAITDMSNGYFGISATSAFIIDPTATGRLLIDNCNISRPSGTADFDRSRFIDGGSDNFLIRVVNSEINEWSWTNNNGLANFVDKCKFSYSGLRINNAGSPTQLSLELTEGVNFLQNVDPTGYSLTTSSTTAAGWTVANGTAGPVFAKNTAATPQVPGGTEYIRVDSGAASGGIFDQQTPTYITGNKDYVFESWFRGFGAGVGMSCTCTIQWFDFSGALISSSPAFAMTLAEMTTYGYIGQFKRVRAAVKSPPNAHKFRVRMQLGSNTIIGIASPVLK